MENKTVSRALRLLSQLMELHEENAFKIKTIANASLKVDKLSFPIAEKSLSELEKIDGIGKSTAYKIRAFLDTGSISELQTLLAATPQGVLEMLQIKGIGPKKILIIWKELAIENIGELYYACNENRLIEAKGFGLKTQEAIRLMIEFRMASNGKFLYAQIDQLAEQLLTTLKQSFPGAQVALTGEFRRRCEIISELQILIGTNNTEGVLTAIHQIPSLKHQHTTANIWKGKADNGLSVAIHCCEKVDFSTSLFNETGSEEHVKAVLDLIVDKNGLPPENEVSIYQKAGLSYIEPELREGVTFINRAAKKSLPKLITFSDLKGALHNHSTWSDGVNTLEEMALYCRDKLKLEYLGICDHSKSAFYANGLSIERVLQQQEEIDHLNKKLLHFHIFKGIESDILNDGALDYPEEILLKFDFVVASVHANLKMKEEKATARLIKAVENPYTTILGHPTGRLLLSRNGYPIDYKKVIDACAANGVVIEINANPFRLDLDWRWQQYALEKGVLLSINPDAHRIKGFLDMHYGVLAARKGGLEKERCLNAMTLAEITETFAIRKQNRP
ncbi:MAG: helix-hairpin-helix domain-containing protein [Sphingobacteriaceae bacterium]